MKCGIPKHNIMWDDENLNNVKSVENLTRYFLGGAEILIKMHHIGVIEKDIQKSLKLYIKFGYIQLSDIVDDYYQNNKIVFIKNHECGQVLELIEPLNEQSSVYNFKTGLHHICYEVDESEKFIKKFKKLKVGKIFKGPIKAPAIDDRQVFFACLNNGLFVEFLT